MFSSATGSICLPSVRLTEVSGFEESGFFGGTAEYLVSDLMN